MILVTGAAGKTGRAVMRALMSSGVEARALVHRKEQVESAYALGAHEAIVADLGIPETLTPGFRGVEKVYHICPNVSPDEITFGMNAIHAAQMSGVEHFVYHSVLHPQTEAMPHHWKKLRVEEGLLQSGLPFTILRPTAYMQNIQTHWQTILEKNIYPVPYPVETRLSLVDLEDVAEAAAIVMTREDHLGSTYELVGTTPLSQIEIAATLSQVLGVPIRAVRQDHADWERSARDRGLGNYQIEALIKMFEYYEHYAFEGNPHITEWLLGRSPVTLTDFIQRTISSG